MKYKFQCDCCGAIAETDEDNINIPILAMKHDEKCNAETGAPWHAIRRYDWRFPNAPQV